MNLCKYANAAKSPCDGIGGTVKRKIAETSLQRLVTIQIQTFQAVDKFCNENIAEITFFSIYKKDMVQVREALDARYLLYDTVLGTRSCHHFESSSTTSVKGKQLTDEYLYITFSAMLTTSEIALKFKPNDYATSICDGFWWLVLFDSISIEEKNVT